MRMRPPPTSPQDRPGSGPVPVAPVQQFVISGIRITVYGLDRVYQAIERERRSTDGFRPLDVVCLWLFHGRLSSADSMRHQAMEITDHVYANLNRSEHPDRYFIAVTFDHRNHGSRMADQTANLSWIQGNQAHAPDMYSIYEGTSHDTSMLIRLIESYIFTTDQYGRPSGQIISHLALGVSLGGHTAWHLAIHEPAIHGVVTIVGAPDYKRLMEDRAIKCKRIAAGEHFFPSTDFPPSLLSEVERTDPMQVLFETPTIPIPGRNQPLADELQLERERVQKRLGGKCILVLSGGKDELVPYRVSVEPFLRRLHRAISDLPRDRVFVDDRVYPDAGHETTPAMRKASIDFVTKYVCQAKLKARL